MNRITQKRRTRGLGTLVFLVLTLVAGEFLEAEVVINELLASNVDLLSDEEGDSADWAELYNAGNEVVDLSGYGLSDNANDPFRWVFPPGVRISPGDYLLVWCSGKDRSAPPFNLLRTPGANIVFNPDLVSLEASWRYLVGAPEDPGPPADWTQLNFSDEDWPEGKPGFGFGDEDDVTVLPADIGAVFLRHVFVFDPANQGGNLVLEVDFDDGFLAYLNGTRLLSVNFPDGEEPSFASVANFSREAGNAELFNLSESQHLLHPGENVLAMVALNRRATNNDLSLIPQLGSLPPVFHSNFSLSSDGESLQLTDAGGQFRDGVEFPPQFANQSFGRSPDGSGEFHYHLDPSPRAENSGATSKTPLVVSDTSFSVDRGFFEEPFEVEISTATPGAEIRYTLNGEWPTQTDMIYVGPLSISKTTVLRAAAFKEGLSPSNVDTQTYIFLDDIIVQDRTSTTRDFGLPTSWVTTPPDYGMDPEVIGQNGDDRYGGKYAMTIKDDLLSIPTMSIVMDNKDLFGSTGIYSHSDKRGIEWERPTSVELVHPDGTEGFQVNAGIRIHGGAFRTHGLTKKHSMRLIFRGRYGPTRLRYPLFGPTAARDFNVIVLRAFANDGWQWNGSAAHPTFCRDTFAMETLQAMGGVAPHGIFVHLYINGVYWGMYNPVERPDHSFSASYFGGDPADWDAISNGEASNGTVTAWNTLVSKSRNLSSNEAYFALHGKNPDGTDNPDLPVYLDLDNYLNYIILNQWIGNLDWPHKNYWVGNHRVNNGDRKSQGFKFYPWDSEWSLGWQWAHQDVNCPYDRTGIREGTAIPYAAARSNPEFVIKFADVVHKNFFNGGPMYVDPQNPAWDPAQPDRNIPARNFRSIADRVDRAIVAESARWGDQHEAEFGRPFTHDEHWEVKMEFMLTEYFPCRTPRVLQQYRGIGLYPPVDAPSFNQHGGPIAPGFGLVLRAPQGDIFFTTDGTDPRLVGGEISPTADLAEPPDTASILVEGTPMRALVPEDGSLGLDWTDPDFDDSGWLEGPTPVGFETSTGYEDVIGTDIGDLMAGKRSSVYLRQEFSVENAASVSSLILRMKYDDGFIAYLNGKKIASRNAPQPPRWDSRSTAGHSDSLAVVFESMDLSNSNTLVSEGRNVLAIHGFNTSVNGNDFLISAQIESAVGAALTLLNETTTVKARAFANERWSALNEATFVVMPDLRITEVMYHPTAPFFEEGDFEYVELQNMGDESLDLTGFQVEGGINFDFSRSVVSTLESGEFVVIVKNPSALLLLHENVENLLIAGQFDGRLNNDGDRIILKGPGGETIHDFVYEDHWYPMTDGGGHSLVVRDVSSPPEDWSFKETWRASSSVHGSPSKPDDTDPGGSQLPGDANQDGALDVSDIRGLLISLFASMPPARPCAGSTLDAGPNRALLDINTDGRVNITDAVALILYLFKGGQPPGLGTDCVPIEGCPDVCGA